MKNTTEQFPEVRLLDKMVKGISRTYNKTHFITSIKEGVHVVYLSLFDRLSWFRISQSVVEPFRFRFLYRIKSGDDFFSCHIP